MERTKNVAVIGLLTLCVLTSLALSQTVSKDPISSAASAWMLVPTPYLAWNEDISVSLRTQRDKYWDDASFSTVPLTAPNQMGRGVSRGSFSGHDPEIPDRPNRTILTATFTKYRSILSSSERSMYTEITLHVDEVFEDRTGSGHLVTGKDVTLLLPGGTVILGNGQTLSADIMPLKMSLQPAHKYLLIMSYHPEADFYSFTDNWDISNGLVQPNTERSQYLANTGRSSLSGLRVDQLGSAVSKEAIRAKIVTQEEPINEDSDSHGTGPDSSSLWVLQQPAIVSTVEQSPSISYRQRLTCSPTSHG